MTAAHTPGPWAVLDDDSLDGCDFIPIETDQPTGPLCRLICEVRPDFSDSVGAIKATDRANARLIAAAPDLLTALQLAQPYVANCAEAGALFNRRDLEAVNIAIARATDGETT